MYKFPIFEYFQRQSTDTLKIQKIISFFQGFNITIWFENCNWYLLHNLKFHMLAQKITYPLLHLLV